MCAYCALYVCLLCACWDSERRSCCDQGSRGEQGPPPSTRGLPLVHHSYSTVVQPSVGLTEWVGGEGRADPHQQWGFHWCSVASVAVAGPNGVWFSTKKIFLRHRLAASVTPSEGHSRSFHLWHRLAGCVRLRQGSLRTSCLWRA